MKTVGAYGSCALIPGMGFISAYVHIKGENNFHCSIFEFSLQ